METYFLEGEKILWRGRPKVSMAINKLGLIIKLLVSIILFNFGAYAFFYVSSEELIYNNRILMLLPALVSLVIPIILIMTIVRELVILKTTTYIVTDRRVLFTRSILRPTIYEIEIGNINYLDYIEKNQGYGDISFEDSIYKSLNIDGSVSKRILHNTRSFYGVRDVKNVYELIANLL